MASNSQEGSNVDVQGQEPLTQEGSNVDVQGQEPLTQDADADADVSTTNKRRKTSKVWDDFQEVDIPNVGLKAVCNHCKAKFARGGPGASTSHLKRHLTNCLKKRLAQSGKKETTQTTLTFQPSSSAVNPFLSPTGKCSNEKMREAIATAIMVHETPFSFVEDTAWRWVFQCANPDFEKVSRNTVKNDCIGLYEAEKKLLKAQLKSVEKISITTDMWKSNHQIAEYMVITGHFIDSEWKLQKRVLSFVKVPPPRRGVDVADAILKCLQLWGIENKVFSVSVDNAAYNDVCIRTMKSTLSRNTKLVLGGELFHVRCCAHILNLLVQYGLTQIKDIIENVRESVKYINHSDSRLKTFSDIVKQMGIKERKLVIDCPTRWNSTYEMLNIASRFKDVFPEYKERDPYYNCLPSTEEWEKVDKVCHLLKVFSHATNIISGSDYPTANLYLPEVYMVKVVIDKAAEDSSDFMRGMARFMKEKFDKYWGECNLLMAIASVLDPRCKLEVVSLCFPLIYKSDFEAKVNIEKVRQALEDIYNDYLQESFSNVDVITGVEGSSSSSPSAEVSQHSESGFAQLMSMIRARESTHSVKSELKCYLEEGVFVSEDNSHLSFDALEWWKSNNMKYKILSKMAKDILAVPVSTVASESTFSAGGRVIDAYRSSLAENTVQALICGADWLRNKYGIKKKHKEEASSQHIKLLI